MIPAELTRLTSDQLGERMKSFYEERTRTSLPRRTYTIIRCDGRSFSNYTKSLKKPFDTDFLVDMEIAAAALCREVQGCALAYTQSDEISIVATDFTTQTTDAWFDGQVQKIVSIAAAVATGAFIAARAARGLLDPKRLPGFDARVFTIPTREDVAAYLWWRERDAIRNSVQMMARSKFSHKEMAGVSVAQAREKLREIGAPWEALPVRIKQGAVVEKIQQPRETKLPDGSVQTFIRGVWTATEAPSFSSDSAYLERLIPKLPAETKVVNDDTGEDEEGAGDDSSCDP